MGGTIGEVPCLLGLLFNQSNDSVFFGDATQIYGIQDGLPKVWSKTNWEMMDFRHIHPPPRFGWIRRCTPLFGVKF